MREFLYSMFNYSDLLLYLSMDEISNLKNSLDSIALSHPDPRLRTYATVLDISLRGDGVDFTYEEVAAFLLRISSKSDASRPLSIELAKRLIAGLKMEGDEHSD